MSSFVTIQTLLIMVPILLIYLFCVGDTFLLFFSRVLRSNLLEDQYNMRFPLALALGTVITPIIISFLSIFHLLNFWSAILFFAIFLIVRMSQFNWTSIKFVELFESISISQLRKHKHKILFLILYWTIFGVSLIIRLYYIIY